MDDSVRGEFAVQHQDLSLGPSSHVKAKWLLSVTPVLGRQRYVDCWSLLVNQSSHNSGLWVQWKIPSPQIRQWVTEEDTCCWPLASTSTHTVYWSLFCCSDKAPRPRQLREEKDPFVLTVPGAAVAMVQKAAASSRHKWGQDTQSSHPLPYAQSRGANCRCKNL